MRFLRCVEANLKINPIEATAVGDYRYNDQLSDYSLLRPSDMTPA
jgi:hypothetical protein